MNQLKIKMLDLMSEDFEIFEREIIEYDFDCSFNYGFNPRDYVKNHRNTEKRKFDKYTILHNVRVRDYYLQGFDEKIELPIGSLDLSLKTEMIDSFTSEASFELSMSGEGYELTSLDMYSLKAELEVVGLTSLSESWEFDFYKAYYHYISNDLDSSFLALSRALEKMIRYYTDTLSSKDSFDYIFRKTFVSLKESDKEVFKKFKNLNLLRNKIKHKQSGLANKEKLEQLLKVFEWSYQYV